MNCPKCGGLVYSTNMCTNDAWLIGLYCKTDKCGFSGTIHVSVPNELIDQTPVVAYYYELKER